MRLDVFRIRQGRFLTQNRWVLCFTVIVLALSCIGTIRHDGYSAFSANHKYGNFSSVGVNWNISKEKFMENSSIFNSLALRASYGTNGNQSIAPYSTLSKISNGYYYYQGDANYTYTQAVGSLG
jgi:hypothetical protein